MFGNGGLRELFEEDPFFREPFAAQHQFMHQMMRSFSDPFGRDPFLSITEGGQRTQDSMIPRGHHDSQIALRGNHRASSCSLMPFGSFGSRNSDFRDPFFAIDRTISNMRNSMLELRRNFDQLSLSPDAHSFSSSSVMTYSKTGDEPPKVFQASAQTHTAPGGIKETRKALRDSESGLEKMAIGHHIHDRAHVIKKSKNNKTGDQELNQEFINLDEAEAHIFDEEWQKEIMKFGTSRAKCNLGAVKHRNNHHISKEDALRREKPHSKPLMAGSRKPEVSVENLNVKGSHVPIKTSKR